ncbi:MAG: hypothetical protein M1827_000959 [Pycnora praestabilis]|nr:MAG: hypothetical protein M1827_000959 [Pycnora praestabilis]
MATEPTPLPVNGNYGNLQQTQHYTGAEQNLSSHQTNHASAGAAPGSFGSQGVNVPSSAGSTTSVANEGSATIPKDEVGWYFVEQYYTTLSRSPEKLHLFYNKRSQFVSGVEAEKVSVSVGQRAISDRIKELDIQDCKVRVSNVDSQASFQNIVVQVIGEMSNKAAPHHKFVQTFILAEQPNGYFVLNDIFRYINEEEDEEELAEGTEVEEVTAAQTADPQEESTIEPEPKTLTSSDDPVEQQHDADQVDKQLKEKLLKDTPTEDEPSVDPPMLNGNASEAELTEVDHADEAPAAAVSVEEHKDESNTEAAESEVAIEASGPEKPKDPEPTRAVSPVQDTSSKTVASTPAIKPTAPKTWANLVAANRTAAPVAPSSASSTSPAPTQPRSAAPAGKADPTAASVSESTPSPAQPSPGAGWQTAGQEHAKRQSRPQSVSASGEKDNVLAYVKNVTEKVDAAALKSTLQKYGDLAYFDVSRQKNCAFVEFANGSGYAAAVAANPHQIGGEQIYVEERRPRPNAYGGGYNAARGGMGRGGRGGAEGRPGSQGRGGFQKEGGRGGYASRGRGGNVTPRGRGGA